MNTAWTDRADNAEYIASLLPPASVDLRPLTEALQVVACWLRDPLSGAEDGILNTARMGIIVGTCVPEEPQPEDSFLHIRRVLYGISTSTSLSLSLSLLNIHILCSSFLSLSYFTIVDRNNSTYFLFYKKFMV